MLCYRCQHRVDFLENNNIRPRYECGDITTSKYGCYMWIPIKPIVIIPDKKDKRPFMLNFFSSRGYYVRPANIEDKVESIKAKGGFVIQWVLKKKP